MDGLDDESSPFLVPYYPEDDDLYEDYILQDVTREEDDGCSHCAEQGSEAPVERHESQPSLSESQFLMQIVAQEKAEREGTQVSTSDSLPGLFTESDSELTGDAEPKPKKQKTKLKTAAARKPKKQNLEKTKLKPKEEKQLESLDDLNFDAEVEQPDVAFEEDLNFDSDNEAILVQEPNTCFPDKLSTYLEEWDEVACHVQQTKRRLRGKQSGPSNDAAPEAQVPQPPPSTRTSDRAAFLMGLTGKQYRFLRRAEAPIILFQMLFFITGLLPSIRVPDVDCVDFYMGRGHIKECFDVDFRALGYEIADDCVMQNALTLQGLITMILYGMRLCSCGLSHWGTVCSSWVFLSRSSTGRTHRQRARPYILLVSEARQHPSVADVPDAAPSASQRHCMDFGTTGIIHHVLVGRHAVVLAALPMARRQHVHGSIWRPNSQANKAPLKQVVGLEDDEEANRRRPSSIP